VPFRAQAPDIFRPGLALSSPHSAASTQSSLLRAVPRTARSPRADRAAAGSFQPDKHVYQGYLGHFRFLAKIERKSDFHAVYNDMSYQLNANDFLVLPTTFAYAMILACAFAQRRRK
jgi:hypothetical protein